MMDRLNIISWNVWGLGDKHCRKVRSVFRRQLRKSLVARIDVRLIQQHHLNEQRIKNMEICCQASGDSSGGMQLGIIILKQDFALQ